MQSGAVVPATGPDPNRSKRADLSSSSGAKNSPPDKSMKPIVGDLILLTFRR